MSKYNVEYVLNLKDRVSGQLKAIQAQTSRLNKAFSGIGGTLAGFGLAFAGFELIKTALKNAVEAEEVDKRLIETAERLAGANREQAQSLIDLAGATQVRSRFGDEDIKVQQTALLQYGLTIKEVKKLTPIIADFAAATGQDMAGATQKVIQGLNGMTRGLKVHGVELQAGGSKAENMTQIMEQLNSKFGGSAAKDLETTSGRVEQLKNSFGDLLETIGTLSIEGEGGGIIGYLNEFAVAADETLKFLTGKQSEYTTNINSIARTQALSIDKQVQANQGLIDSQLNSNNSLESYFALLNQGGKLQSQFQSSLNEIQMYDAFGNITDQYQEYAIGLLAAQQSQADLIESTKQYVLGLDSVGQNQAFQKIANQMGLATEEVRKFFGELGKGDSPIEKTLTTVADFEEEISRLKKAQKDVSDPATYKKLGRQIADNERKMASITGRTTGSGSSGTGANATSSTLTSRSPQTFNINITKLVETINTTKPQLNTTDSQTMRQITEALVMAVNDVQTTVQ